MKDILEEIVAWKRIEISRQKEALPPHLIYRQVEDLMTQEEDLPGVSMSESLKSSSSGIIAEFKRKSPSKGWIKEEGTPDIIPPAYAVNGAAAISILTDDKYFGGSLDYIRTARPLVKCPILRKDFIIDEYQLFQARLAGANAILLIAADLSKSDCKTLAHTAHELGLEVLLETHSEAELDYFNDETIDMLGVNNRNLGTFHTDVENSFRMASLLPRTVVKVSESGISNPQTIRKLRQAGFCGFLMGEHFMRAADPGAALKEFLLEL